jgi:hypothetical protein
MNQWGVKGLFGAQGVGGVGKVTRSKVATVENWMHRSGIVGIWMLGMRHSAIVFRYLRMHPVCVHLARERVVAKVVGSLFTWQGSAGGGREKGVSGEVDQLPSRDIFEPEFGTTNASPIGKSKLQEKTPT